MAVSAKKLGLNFKVIHDRPVGGGCGKGMMSGRIDEVRVNNRLLSDEETVAIRPIGFALVFR